MANAKILEMKQGIVEEISTHIKDSASVVFFEYRGLSVKDMTDLRRKLKETASDVKIYKNTLVTRALEHLNIDLNEAMVGPKAMAYGSDAIAPIKVLSDFAKDHPALQLKVGLVDGNVADEQQLNVYATIPSREGLLTQVAAGLIGIVKDLSICLDLYGKKLEEEK